MRTGDLKHKKQATAKRAKLIICIGLPMLAIAGFAVSEPIRRHNKAQTDSAILVQALSAYAREQAELPHGSYSTICRLLRGESVDGQNPKRLNYIEAEGQEISTKGEFLDPWGHPYRIVFEKELRVYSGGPTGADDRGKGNHISPASQ